MTALFRNRIAYQKLSSVATSMSHMIHFKTFPVLSRIHSGQYDELSPGSLLGFGTITNLFFFHRCGKIPSDSVRTKYFFISNSSTGFELFACNWFNYAIFLLWISVSMTILMLLGGGDTSTIFSYMRGQVGGWKHFSFPMAILYGLPQDRRYVSCIGHCSHLSLLRSFVVPASIPPGAALPRYL